MAAPSINDIITSYLVDLPNKYSTFSMQTSSSNTVLSDSTELDRQVQDLNLQIQKLNRQEETYDREFLDRKNNPAERGLFYKIGLRTTEDWVIAYFLFSYLIFFLLALLYVLIYSTKKVIGAALVVAFTLLFGFISLLLLHRYA